MKDLTTHERSVVLLSAVALPLAAAGLRLVGLKRLRGLLLRAVAPPRAAADLAMARHLAELVQAAGARTWPRPNCLSRSLLLEWLLRRRGLRAELRIGVRRAAGALQAHAWVECEGVPVNDEPDIAKYFAPLPEMPPLPGVAPP